MESTLLYNIPEFANSAMPLEWPIAVYFFLTGSLAGLYITSVIATLMKKEEWQPTAKLGAVGAVVLLMTAPVLLIIDLNQPLRFWHLFVYLNPTSPLTWGSFFLAADAVVCLVYTYFVLQNNTRMARMWGLGRAADCHRRTRLHRILPGPLQRPRLLEHRPEPGPLHGFGHGLRAGGHHYSQQSLSPAICPRDDRRSSGQA